MQVVGEEEEEQHSFWVAVTLLSLLVVEEQLSLQDEMVQAIS